MSLPPGVEGTLKDIFCIGGECSSVLLIRSKREFIRCCCVCMRDFAMNSFVELLSAQCVSVNFSPIVTGLWRESQGRQAGRSDSSC